MRPAGQTGAYTEPHRGRPSHWACEAVPLWQAGQLRISSGTSPSFRVGLGPAGQSAPGLEPLSCTSESESVGRLPAAGRAWAGAAPAGCVNFEPLCGLSRASRICDFTRWSPLSESRPTVVLRSRRRSRC